MSGVTVTGKQVREEIVHRLIDAQARNQRQHELLINLTPEEDCFYDFLVTLGRPPYNVPASKLREGARYIDRIIRLNRDERHDERLVTAVADRLAKDAEHAARNTTAGKTHARIEKLAERLRPALRTILAGAESDPMEYVRASWLVRDTIAEAGSDRLLSSTMRAQLGRLQFEQLERMVRLAAGEETRS